MLVQVHICNNTLSLNFDLKSRYNNSKIFWCSIDDKLCRRKDE